MCFPCFFQPWHADVFDLGAQMLSALIMRAFPFRQMIIFNIDKCIFWVLVKPITDRKSCNNNIM